MNTAQRICTVQKPAQRKYCTCQEIMTSGNAKVIRCTSPKDSEVDERLCFCHSQDKPSLAERLHRRLNQTLDSCIDCACDVYELDSMSPSPDVS